MANLVGSLQLSPGKRPGPGDSNAKTVILLSFGLEQPQNSLCAVGRPSATRRRSASLSVCGDTTAVILRSCLDLRGPSRARVMSNSLSTQGDDWPHDRRAAVRIVGSRDHKVSLYEHLPVQGSDVVRCGTRPFGGERPSHPPSEHGHRRGRGLGGRRAARTKPDRETASAAFRLVEDRRAVGRRRKHGLPPRPWREAPQRATVLRAGRSGAGRAHRSLSGRKASRFSHRLRELRFVHAVAPIKRIDALQVATEQLGVPEHRDRLLQGVVVVGAQKDSGSLAVSRDLEAFVGGGSLLDELGELGTGRSQGESRHVQNSSVASGSSGFPPRGRPGRAEAPIVWALRRVGG